MYLEDYVYNRLEASFYAGFHRTVFALGVSWIIFACVHGIAGKLNSGRIKTECLHQFFNSRSHQWTSNLDLLDTVEQIVIQRLSVSLHSAKLQQRNRPSTWQHDALYIGEFISQ